MRQRAVPPRTNRPRRPWPVVVACLCLAFGASGALAAAFQSTDSIRAAAVAALGTGVQAEAAIDAQLRLPQCVQPLSAAATSAKTVMVRCDDAPGWQLYVPVRIRRQADALVLTTPMRAGETIGDGQVAVQRRDLASTAQPVPADPTAVVGHRLRKAMPTGAVLTQADLDSPGRDFENVQRGDPVVLVSRADGVEVRMSGRALGPAREGGTISVENLASRRIIRGRLVAAGTVEVAL